MKCLIVEDDFATRKLMQVYLSKIGEVDIAINGREALRVFTAALDEAQPYDLICMDIMMPEMDGMEAVGEIRRIEKGHGILGLSGAKIIMTTACGESREIFGAFRSGCEAYLIKPVRKQDLMNEIEKLGFAIPSSAV